MNSDFDDKKNKQAIRSLSLGHFTVDAYSSFITPILPFIASKIGINLAMAASVISISHILSSMSQPFYGFIADKMKKRFFVFWGLLLSCVFLSMTGIVQNYFQLVLFLVLGSIGSGFFHPQATGMVDYFSTYKVKQEMAIFIAMGTLGYSLGPLVSSTVTHLFSLEALPFMAIWGFVAAAGVYKYVPRLSVLPNIDRPKGSFLKATKIVFSNKILLILIMMSMLKALTVQSYCIFLPFVWKNLGYNVSQIGFALFAFSFLGGLATYFSSHLERKIGMKKVFYITMLSALPLTVAYILTYKTFIPASFVIFVLVGIVSMLSTSVNMTLAQNTVKEHKSMISGYVGGFSWGVMGVLFMPLSLAAQYIGIMKMLLVISAIPFVCAYLVRFLPDSEEV